MKNTTNAVILLAAALLFSFGSWLLFSVCEASSFEHVTGKHVSTWDAMFLDLRVQEPAR